MVIKGNNLGDENPGSLVTIGAPATNYVKTQIENNHCRDFLLKNYFEAAANKKPKEKKLLDQNKIFSDERLGLIDIENRKPVKIHNFIEDIVKKVHAWPDRMGKLQYHHILAVYAQVLVRGSKILDQTVEKLLEGNLENLSLEQIRGVIPDKTRSKILRDFKSNSISNLDGVSLEEFKKELNEPLSKAVKKGRFQFTSEQQEKYYTYDDYKTHQYLALMHDMVEDRHVTIEQLEKIARSGGKENQHMLRAISLLPYLDKHNYTDQDGRFVISREDALEAIGQISDYYNQATFIEYAEGRKFDIARLDYVEMVQYKAGYSNEIIRRMQKDCISEKEQFLVLDTKEIDQNNNRHPIRNDFNQMIDVRYVSGLVRGELDKETKQKVEAADKKQQKLILLGRTNIVKYGCCVESILNYKATLEFCKSYTCTGLANSHFFSYSNIIPEGIDKDKEGLERYSGRDANFTEKLEAARKINKQKDVPAI